MTQKIDLDDHQDRVGTTTRTTLGEITRMMARRYARAVEDDNKLFHDVDYARKHGYDDIVVPPNFLSAIIERTEGRSTSELREDGLDPELFPIDLPQDVLLMNGGQQLTFERYVTAGEVIHVEETLADIYKKDTDDMGLLTFFDLRSEYFTDDDEHVLTCEETVIVGDRQ
jgi:acyl dehydratase